LGLAAVLAAAMAVWSAPGRAQGNACTSPNQLQACSMECCGRRSCPPSCEVSCVKACVDACNSPARTQAFNQSKRELQLRCGNRSVR